MGFILGPNIFNISENPPDDCPRAENDANCLERVCNIFNEVIIKIRDKAGEKIPKIAPNLSVAFNFCLMW